MRLLRILCALMGLALPASASYIVGPTISTTTGRATEGLAGKFYVAASSQTSSTPTITLDGATGNLTASSGSFSGPVTASSGTFTQIGTDYSLRTSSGIFVLATGNPGITAPWFSGTFYGPIVGNAATATALAATPSACSLPNVALGITANGNASCSQPSNVTGSAASITGTVNAGQIANGPVASSILPSTIAYTSVANTFTQTQSINYGLVAATASISGALTASSGTFTLTGPTQPSVETSSGIKVDAGSIVNNGSGGDVVKYGVSAATLTTSGKATLGSVLISNITGSAQCLHVDTNGNVTGMGADCAAGGGATTGGNNTWTGTNNFQSDVTMPVYFSSATIATATAFVGATSNGVCVAGSTLTITTPFASMSAEVNLIGSQNQSTTSRFWASFLLDGAYVSPMTSAIAATEWISYGLGHGPANLYWYLPAISQGTHKVCLLMWTTGGTGTLVNDAATTNEWLLKVTR